MRKFFLLFPFFLVHLCGCISFNVSLFGEEGDLKERNLTDAGWDAKIALISIDGLIQQERAASLFYHPSGTPSYLAEQLAKAEQDEDVRAVVLRISSPGGEASASDTMYRQLLEFRRRTKKPVVACIMDIGTSGAYYIACGADKIFAQPTAIVGSIGVIAHLLNIESLMTKVGISVEVIKSGERKDSGSPFRQVTQKEKEEFQSLINGMYERFFNVVLNSRKIEREKLKEVADGRILDSSSAKAAGLIDGVCYLEDAFSVAKNLAGVKDADVVIYERPNTRRPSIYAPFALSEFERMLTDILRPGFYYVADEFLWNR
ncbi:MAG: signal peptide peptidase SppA [Planctomycetota bacterium]|nr:signal peptide peptidase SppA [Planctomycetota bacterium]